MRTESWWKVQTSASLIAEWILERKAESSQAIKALPMLLRQFPVTEQ